MRCSCASAGRLSRAANQAMAAQALYQSAFTSTGLPRRGVTTQPSTLASIQVSGTSSTLVASRQSAGSMWMP